MKRLAVLLFLLPIVWAVTEEEANDAYLNATLDVAHLEQLGYPTVSFNDALVQMQEALKGRNVSELLNRVRILNESGETDKVKLAQEILLLIQTSEQKGIKPGANYSFVLEKAAWIRERKAQAFAAREQLDEFAKMVRSSNETRFLGDVYATLSDAQKAFDEERFTDVAALIARGNDQFEQAMVDAARERAFLRLAQRGIVEYVRTHWVGVLLSAIVFALLCVWAFFEVRLYRAMGKLKTLKIELSAVQDALKSTQQMYFSAQVGSSTYRTRMDEFKRKNNQIQTDIKVWQDLVRKYKLRSLIMRFKPE